MAWSYVVGVTGGIAVGKSAVMTILRQLGADCIDADGVYHELIRPAMPLWGRLRDAFGPDILAPDGEIDRKALGRIVFADKTKLAELDAMTHGAIIAEVIGRKVASDAQVVAIEAVKLIESGMTALCHEVWLVVAAPEVQRERLLARNGIGADEAERRLAAQEDETGRRRHADHVIDNSGTPAELRATVERRWRELPWATMPWATRTILPE